MHAIIYKPARTAMQSGMKKTHRWRLVFDPAATKTVEPLMGWVSGQDTMEQVDLWFKTKQEAIDYAEHKGIAFAVQEANEHTVKPMSYADNFRYDKVRITNT